MDYITSWFQTGSYFPTRINFFYRQAFNCIQFRDRTAQNRKRVKVVQTAMKV